GVVTESDPIADLERRRIESLARDLVRESRLFLPLAGADCHDSADPCADVARIGLRCGDDVALFGQGVQHDQDVIAQWPDFERIKPQAADLGALRAPALRGDRIPFDLFACLRHSAYCGSGDTS